MLSERSYASDTLSLCVWELKIDMLCEEHGWSGGWACGRCRNENSIEWWLREGHSTSLAEECNYRGRKKGFWIDIHYFLSSWDKEHIWVSPNEVDKPRAYHTEWSKSEREKQISYINTHTHTWNLGKWYWCTYLQGDTDIDNRLEGTGEEGESEVA